MITSNVIHRVFRIRYGDSEGTGFTVEVAGKEYLVTAKHVVAALDGKETISIFSNGDWSHLEVILVGHSPEDADISVLAAARILTPQGLPMEASAGGLIYGQDVYFLGFPYGYTGSFVLGRGGYPLPFVKKATVSLLDRKKMILDGHNNPGFSGGPVVYTEPILTNSSPASRCVRARTSLDTSRSPPPRLQKRWARDLSDGAWSRVRVPRLRREAMAISEPQGGILPSRVRTRCFWC